MILLQPLIMCLLLALLPLSSGSSQENAATEELFFEEIGDPGDDERLYVLIPSAFLNDRTAWTSSVRRMLNSISAVIVASFEVDDGRTGEIELFPKEVAAEINKNGVTFLFLKQDFTVRQVRIPFSVGSE